MIKIPCPDQAYRITIEPADIQPSSEQNGDLSTIGLNFDIVGHLRDEFVVWCMERGLAIPGLEFDDPNDAWSALLVFENDDDAVMFRLMWDKEF